jgi:hypothetical protein
MGLILIPDRIETIDERLSGCPTSRKQTQIPEQIITCGMNLSKGIVFHSA